MDIDILSMEKRERYLLLTNVVVPRPIAWITSMGVSGVLNVAPFSFFNVMSATPPVVGVSIIGWKDTVRYILETKEYVINLVTEEMAKAMNITAIEFPPGESELPHAGLSTVPSRKIAVPGIAQSPIHLECRYRDMIRLSDDGEENYWVMGDVIHVHVEDVFWEDGRIDFARVKPLGRLGGSYYTRVNAKSLLKMPRIRYEEWVNQNG